MSDVAQKKDFFDRARDAVTGAKDMATGFAGAAIDKARDLSSGPESFAEALDELVSTWRGKGDGDVSMASHLRAKADKLLSV